MFQNWQIWINCWQLCPKSACSRSKLTHLHVVLKGPSIPNQCVNVISQQEGKKPWINSSFLKTLCHWSKDLMHQGIPGWQKAKDGTIVRSSNYLQKKCRGLDTETFPRSPSLLTGLELVLNWFVPIELVSVRGSKKHQPGSNLKWCKGWWASDLQLRINASNDSVQLLLPSYTSELKLLVRLFFSPLNTAEIQSSHWAEPRCMPNGLRPSNLQQDEIMRENPADCEIGAAHCRGRLRVAASHGFGIAENLHRP